MVYPQGMDSIAVADSTRRIPADRDCRRRTTMASRIVRNAHQRLGWLASSQAKQAKWKTVKSLFISPGDGHPNQHPAFKAELSVVTVEAENGASVLYLTTVASLELVKGLLMNVLYARSGGISMYVDDEFQSILKQCEQAMKLQEEEAEQIVEAVRRNPEVEVVANTEEEKRG
jgi:hypothetical protein